MLISVWSGSLHDPSHSKSMVRSAVSHAHTEGTSRLWYMEMDRRSRVRPNFKGFRDGQASSVVFQWPYQGGRRRFYLPIWDNYCIQFWRCVSAFADILKNHRLWSTLNCNRNGMFLIRWLKYSWELLGSKYPRNFRVMSMFSFYNISFLINPGPLT